MPRHIRDLPFPIPIMNSQVEEDGLGSGGAGSRGAGSSDELWAQMQVLVSQSSFTLLLVFGIWFYSNSGLGIWYFGFTIKHHFALILISHTLFQPKERQCDAGDRLNWTSS